MILDRVIFFLFSFQVCVSFNFISIIKWGKCIFLCLFIHTKSSFKSQSFKIMRQYKMKCPWTSFYMQRPNPSLSIFTSSNIHQSYFFCPSCNLTSSSLDLLCIRNICIQNDVCIHIIDRRKCFFLVNHFENVLIMHFRWSLLQM